MPGAVRPGADAQRPSPGEAVTPRQVLPPPPPLFLMGLLGPVLQGAGAEVINTKRLLRRSSQAPGLGLREGSVLPALLDLQISNKELS